MSDEDSGATPPGFRRDAAGLDELYSFIVRVRRIMPPSGRGAAGIRFQLEDTRSGSVWNFAEFSHVVEKLSARVEAITRSTQQGR